MSRFTWAIFLTGWFCFMECAAGAAPANDDFTNREFLGSMVPVSDAGTTVMASGEAGEPQIGGTLTSIWWSWEAPVTQLYRVSVSSTLTTVLVYTGESVTSLTEVANEGFVQELNFPATAGQRYEFQVIGAGGAAVNFQIDGVEVSTPELTSLEILPSSVDIGFSSVDVRVEASATAPQGEIEEIEVIVNLPGRDIKSVLGDFENVGDGNFEGFLKVPLYLPVGVHSLSVIVRSDSGGVARYGGVGEPTLPVGVSQNLSIVNGGPADFNAPLLRSLSFGGNGRIPYNPGGSVSVRALARIAEDLSGLGQGVLTVYDAISGRVLGEGIVGSSNLSSGSVMDGFYDFEIFIDELPDQVGPLLTDFVISDLSRLSRTYGDVSPGLLPYPMPFTPMEIVDTRPPAYQTWLNQNAEIPVGMRAPDDDPDGDGYPNGIEFYLGLNPMVDSSSVATDPNAGNAPQIIFENGEFGIRVIPSSANLALGRVTTAPKAQVLSGGTIWNDVLVSESVGDALQFVVPYDSATAKLMRFVVSFSE